MGLKMMTEGRDRRETGAAPTYKCANCGKVRYNPCTCAKKGDNKKGEKPGASGKAAGK